MRLSLTLCVLLLAACASPPTQEQIDTALKATLEAGRSQLEKGNAPEASVLARAVRRVDSEYPGLQELIQQIGPKGEDFHNRAWLGVNRRPRVMEKRNIGVRILAYPFDRIFDLLDLVSFDVSVGPGAYANVHLTRAAQLGAGLRAKLGVGLLDPRMLGFTTEAEAGVAALALGTQAFSGAKVGVPGGIYASSDLLAGLHSPADTLYQEYRDYYALGFGVQAGLIGVDAGIHPVQIFDALLGFVLVDFASDDFARTRGLRLTSADRQLLGNVNEIERARVWKGDKDAAEPAPVSE
jgi:hypothetical protein